MRLQLLVSLASLFLVATKVLCDDWTKFRKFSHPPMCDYVSSDLPDCGHNDDEYGRIFTRAVCLPGNVKYCSQDISFDGWFSRFLNTDGRFPDLTPQQIAYANG